MAKTMHTRAGWIDPSPDKLEKEELRLTFPSDRLSLAEFFALVKDLPIDTTFLAVVPNQWSADDHEDLVVVSTRLETDDEFEHRQLCIQEAKHKKSIDDAEAKELAFYERLRLKYGI